MLSTTPGTTRRRVAIIGAGVSGLAAAYRLREIQLESGQPLEITVLESSQRAGGVLKTTFEQGCLLEAGPDCFISEKPEGLALVQRLGLSDQLIETNSEFRQSFIVSRGRLSPVPQGFHLLAPTQFWPFLKSPIFSWSGKFRMALESLLPAKRGGADESLADFVTRRFGSEALERMAQPMVGGIYTADPAKLSLKATMPRFLNLEEKYGSVIRGMLAERKKSSIGSQSGTSGARYSLFLSFRKGMQTLTDALVDSLPPGLLRTNCPVQEISKTTGGWKITTTEGENLHADAVILAARTHASSLLLRNVDNNLANELAGIQYASSATINLVFKREQISHPLNGFGFVVPVAEGRRIIACSFSSVKFAGRAPEGFVLLRAFAGGALQPEVYQLDDDELVHSTIQDLRQLLGLSGPPALVRLQRWPEAMPQYHVGHLDRIARIRNSVSRLPGLALAGNAFDGAGIPDCIRTGERAAEATLRYLSDLEKNSVNLSSK